jgi:hypothetical protein
MTYTQTPSIPHSDGQVMLASTNEFSFRLNITNEAPDTAVNPVLIIELPQQTRLSRTVRTYPLLNCKHHEPKSE